jgi:hypothetical protein
MVAVAFIFPSCISSMCCFNVVDHLNLAVHWLQEYGCPITLCTARMWFFKLWTFLYNFPHLKHFTDAFSKWDLFYVKIPKYREKIDFKKDKECKYCKKCFFHFVGVEDHVRKYHMKEADVETHLEELKSLRMETCKICNKTFNSQHLDHFQN